MRGATKQGHHQEYVNAAKAQALEQGMVDVFDVYLVVDGVPQKA